MNKNLKRMLKTFPVISIPYKIKNYFYTKKRERESKEKHVINSSGTENKKTIYIIRRFNQSGFFSNYFFVLGHIIYAINNNYIPVVDMKNYPTLYSEREELYGTKNAWEYYFYQPTDEMSLDSAYKSKEYILSSGLYQYDHVPFYEGGIRFPIPELVNYLKPYIEKYMRIKSEYIEEAESIYNNFECKSVVGVHIRGTDMKTAPNHLVPPFVGQYILKLQELIEHNKNIDKIFLCTDEVQTIDIMKQKFGNMILCTDSFRSSDGKSVHGKHGNESRVNHRYLMGKEVLLDALLLAKCDYLCCGHSNVSYAAIVLNQNRYKGIFLLENKDQNRNLNVTAQQK